MIARPDIARMRLLLVAAAGFVCLVAGAGWALAGPDIFLNAVMAGIAGCF